MATAAVVVASVIALVAVSLVAVVLAVKLTEPSSDDAKEMTTSTVEPPAPTTTISVDDAVPVDGCEGLRSVTADAIVSVASSGPCQIRPDASVTNVTVTGTWEGDLDCRSCNGWSFVKMDVTEGSISMMGGKGWSILDSTLDGGKRGQFRVVGTGATHEDRQPTEWRIAGNTIRNAGCGDPSTEAFNQAHSVYIIGGNEPMYGLLEDNVIEHNGCGAALKIGGTGVQGSSSFDTDGADDLIARRNTIRNVEAGPDQTAVLVNTNADRIKLIDNTLEAGQLAISLSGPYSGEGFEAIDNVIAAPRFLRVKHWNRPNLGPATPAFGESFLNVDDPGPCDPWGTCEGNHRP